jgi:hypothetical protein
VFADRPARPDERVRAAGRLGPAIRRGESRSLVLRGEAGTGKTALLEYLIAWASDLTVVRAVGVESEMELAFASLHEVCGPLLDRLDRLPAPQRQAMEIVFGRSAGGAPDRSWRTRWPARTPSRSGVIYCADGTEIAARSTASGL